MTLRSILTGRGVNSDFHIVRLDFGGAVLEQVRIGPEAAPDLAVERVQIGFGWRLLGPEIRSLRLLRPVLRLRLNPADGLSGGDLDHLGGGRGGGGRPALPRMRLEIENGRALLEAPFGPIEATLNSSGVLGEDFAARALVAETSEGDGPYRLERGAADLVVTSRGGAIEARLTAGGALAWNGARVTGAGLSLTATAPLDLKRIEAQANARLASVQDLGGFSARHIIGALQFSSEAPNAWRSEINIAADESAIAGAGLRAARAQARFDAHDGDGRGAVTLTGASFSGFGLRSAQPSARAELRFRSSEALQAEARLRVQLANTALSATARQNLRRSIPNVGGAPIGPTFAALERALDAAAGRFDLAAPLRLTLNNGAARIETEGPLEARAATGALAQVAPLTAAAPALTLHWPGPRIAGAARLALSGGGAPEAQLDLHTIAWAAQAPFTAEGALKVMQWRAGGASIVADAIALRFIAPPHGAGQLALSGPVRITGPVGNGVVRDLDADLDLDVAWGDGWRVTPKQSCTPLRLGGLDVAGLAFRGGALNLCVANNTALIAADARHRLSGGFFVDGLRLDGRLAGGGQPAHLNARRVFGRFGGGDGDILLAIETSAPTLHVQFGPARTLRVAVQRLTANARIHEGWRVDGGFEAGALSDPSLPGVVSAIAGDWSAAPERGEAVLRVSAGQARVVAHAAGEAEPRALFNPVRVANMDAVLRAGKIDANGDILLEERARGLAQFTAHHDLGAGRGGAHVSADDLVFGEALQPYEISELARGVIDNVNGHASATADVAWTNEAVTASGDVRPNGLSLATATIPVIENVRGLVHFDDLFKLTTPPGQIVTIGLVNPGVAVREGNVRFQLLPQNRVAIEQAEFAFAGGVLAVAPTQIALGAAETRFELTLRDVDVAALVAQLNMPDLRATGRVEGNFPLLLTSRTAFIENGELHAAPGGGDIAYTGTAGDAATGAARLAFEALRSFRYEALSLTLNGDLSGDVVTSVTFRGENSGRPVNLAPVAPMPGLGQINVRGVPFAFNVRVTAPFRRLAETAASITDARTLIDRARENQQNPPAPVDQTPQAPR